LPHDQRLIPGAVRRNSEDAADWGGEYAGQAGHRRCLRGQSSPRAPRLAAPRQCPCRNAEGGFEGWKEAKLPLIQASKLPPRDAKGRTVWVTRARPKIDRIAAPG